MLSLKSYVWKCVVGLEAVYVVCLAGGFVVWRSVEAGELHHTLFETMPGFVWGSVSSYVLGGVYMLFAAIIYGSYMVWMHNSSIKTYKK